MFPGYILTKLIEYVNKKVLCIDEGWILLRVLSCDQVSFEHESHPAELTNLWPFAQVCCISVLGDTLGCDSVSCAEAIEDQCAQDMRLALSFRELDKGQKAVKFRFLRLREELQCFKYLLVERVVF